MPEQRHYVLTRLAELDLHEARAWSLARWGSKLTRAYFGDLHKAASMIQREVLEIKNRIKRGELSLPE